MVSALLTRGPTANWCLFSFTWQWMIKKNGHFFLRKLEEIPSRPESQRLWTDIQPHPLASTLSANVACISKNVKLMFVLWCVDYAGWITVSHVNTIHQLETRFRRLNDWRQVVCSRHKIRPLGRIASLPLSLDTLDISYVFESRRHTMHLQLLSMIHHPRTTDCIPHLEAIWSADRRNYWEGSLGHSEGIDRTKWNKLIKISRFPTQNQQFQSGGFLWLFLGGGPHITS